MPYWNDAQLSWGLEKFGSNPEIDNLYWLCLLSCEVLQEYDGAGLGAWTRWGPAFNGLHILTGFRSLAEAGTGFPGQFAHNILERWWWRQCDDHCTGVGETPPP